MECVLRLGEWAVIGRGWIQRRRIMFAGESSSGMYSIVVEWSQNHNSAAGNLYFHESQREFQVLDGRVSILNVTRDELRFRFERTGAGG